MISWFANPLLASGFGSAWMLSWIAAAAIPIVIHLLTRRRQSRQPWAAMQLLREVLERESKRVRFEQIILLVIRVSILILLALALARPFFSNPRDASSDSTESTRPKLWILGFDLSYSMGYLDESGSRLQRAKEIASRKLAEAKEGDAFSLLTFGSPSQAVIRRPTFDRAQVLSEIRKLQTKDTGADIVGGLQTIQAIADDALKEPNLPSDIEVTLLSDLGEDSWTRLIDSQSEILLQLSRTARLDVQSLMGQSRPENLAITGIRVDKPSSLVGESLEVTVEVSNFGNTSTDEVPIQLGLNGQTVNSRNVTLPAGKATEVTFSIQPLQQGLMVISASLPDDRLLVDNQRYRVIEIRRQDRLLFVEESKDDTRLLRMSLVNTASRGSADSPAANIAALSESADRLETVDTVDLPSLDLKNWEALVLNDVAFIEPNLIDQLQRFVRSGGALIIGFGPKTSAESWNNLLQDENFLGFEFDRVSAEQAWSIDPVGYESPVTAPFSGFPDAGLLTTPIFRHWIIKQRAESLVTDVGISNSTPLIVRNSWGTGSVASILSAPEAGIQVSGRGNEASNSESWNAIAIWPSFVPVMQQLLRSQLSNVLTQYNLQTAQIIQGKTDRSARSQVHVISPDGVEHPLTTEPIAELGFGWFFTNTSKSGVYYLRNEQSNLTPFALNVDPVQSSLQSISLDSLPKSNELPDTQIPVDPSLIRENPPPGAELAQWLLGLLIGLLVTESLVARHLGRRAG